MDTYSSSCSPGETIMAALIGLHPRRFSDLIHCLSSDLCLQHRRLAFLLLSPLHFSDTLTYLHSLSLAEKTLLLARLLLRSLSKLLHPLTIRSRDSRWRDGGHAVCSLRLQELDAGLLLLSMCDVYDRKKTSVVDWRAEIAEYLVERTLSIDGLGAQGWVIVSRYVDAAVKCRRLLEVVSGGRRPGGGGGEPEVNKAGLDVAASVAAVVSLPSVECKRAGWECVVCKEEIEIGRDVCVLPCEHGYHWGCILPWLRKRNTCPCCRFELPTDDVFCEIERLWKTTVIS